MAIFLSPDLGFALLNSACALATPHPNHDAYDTVQPENAGVAALSHCEFEVGGQGLRGSLNRIL